MHGHKPLFLCGLERMKAVKIDGVDASIENIENGTYTVNRPFTLAVKGELGDAAQDFLNYIMSAEGQTVIEENGYIKIDDAAAAFESNGAEGKVVVAGSSSVTPVMEKLKEAYAAVNTNVTIEINTSDSSTGVSSAIEGTCDIGMASRALKESETSEGVKEITIAKDGIAVIVNNNNPVEDLTTNSDNSNIPIAEEVPFILTDGKHYWFMAEDVKVMELRESDLEEMPYCKMEIRMLEE